MRPPLASTHCNFKPARDGCMLLETQLDRIGPPGSRKTTTTTPLKDFSGIQIVPHFANVLQSLHTLSPPADSPIRRLFPTQLVNWMRGFCVMVSLFYEYFIYWLYCCCELPSVA